MFANFSDFYNRYRGEFKISFITIAITTFITIVISTLYKALDANMIFFVMFASVVVCLLSALLINLKRFLTMIMLNTKNHFIEVDDLFARSKYQKRLGHFSGEKAFLAKKFVDDVFPDIADYLKEDFPSLEKINIIFDSGTTITPIFKNLMAKGLPANLEKKIKTTIYTNNLAGIRELYKIDPSLCALNERDFNLIGGQPLSNYRATTGPETAKFLETIWHRQNDDSNEITISVITANWFLGGLDLKNLQICAKGEGHFQFKKLLIDNSHYIVVVSPLGKILKVGDVDSLHNLIPAPKPKKKDDEYKSYPVNGNNGSVKRVVLLTSFRPKVSKSPFDNHSLTLSKTCELRSTENYVLCDKRYEYEPSGDKWDVIVTELPHTYIRDKFVEAYGYTTELFKQK